SAGPVRHNVSEQIVERLLELFDIARAVILLHVLDAASESADCDSWHVIVALIGLRVFAAAGTQHFLPQRRIFLILANRSYRGPCLAFVNQVDDPQLARSADTF